jgi:hypothetical protein
METYEKYEHSRFPATRFQKNLLNALLVSGNWFHQGVNSRKQYPKQHLNILTSPINTNSKHDNLPHDLLVLFLWIASANERARPTHQRSKQASATPSALCPT